MDTDTDEGRWAEARSILAGAPTESAEQRLRRGRRLIALVAVAMLLVGLALAAGAAAWFGDRGDVGAGDGPRWREITGLVVLIAGFVVVLGAFVLQMRGLRRQWAWRRPFLVLTNRQRRELWKQVRDNAPVDSDRLPLARHLAAGLGVQRVILLAQLGAFVMFVGLLIHSPSPWRLGLLVWVGLALAFGVTGLLRNERRAGRFLADHPDDESVA